MFFIGVGILAMIFFSIVRFVIGLVLVGGIVLGFSQIDIDKLKSGINIPETITPSTTENTGSAFIHTALDPSWFVRNWFSYKATEAIDKKVQEAYNAPTPGVEREILLPVSETPEMLQYVKNCTDLTGDVKFCRQNWVEVASRGGEIFLEPVEREQTKSEIRKISTKKPKVEKEEVVEKPKRERIARAKVKEIKLLDVDNEEYKARRAEALAKPGAIVIRETYH